MFRLPLKPADSCVPISLLSRYLRPGRRRVFCNTVQLAGELAKFQGLEPRLQPTGCMPGLYSRSTFPVYILGLYAWFISVRTFLSSSRPRLVSRIVSGLYSSTEDKRLVALLSSPTVDHLRQFFIHIFNCSLSKP